MEKFNEERLFISNIRRGMLIDICVLCIKPHIFIANLWILFPITFITIYRFAFVKVKCLETYLFWKIFLISLCLGIWKTLNNYAIEDTKPRPIEETFTFKQWELAPFPLSIAWLSTCCKFISWSAWAMACTALYMLWLLSLKAMSNFCSISQSNEASDELFFSILHLDAEDSYLKYFHSGITRYKSLLLRWNQICTKFLKPEIPPWWGRKVSDP